MIRDTSALISHYRASGLSPKKFSTKHKIPISTLQYHLHKQRTMVVDREPRFLSLPAPSAQSRHDVTITVLRGSFTPAQISAIINGGELR